MDANISKAMQITGGVLIGVMLFALLSYFFSSIGIWPTVQDEVMSAEQLAKFNLEYEIYDKKGMYGTDVISCLNKAISNNEKYVVGDRFLAGSKYGDEFCVWIYVRIKSCLTETVEVYYVYNNTADRLANGREKQALGDYNVTEELGGSAFPKDMDSLFKIKFADYYTGIARGSNPKEVRTVPNGVYKGVIDSSSGVDNYLEPDGGTHQLSEDDSFYEGDTNDYKYYSLEDGLDEAISHGFSKTTYDPVAYENNNPLVKLLKNSTQVELTAVNTTGKNSNIWSRVIWKTPLSDFKKRRFKCDFIGYSNTTQRVNRIYFSEI